MGPSLLLHSAMRDGFDILLWYSNRPLLKCLSWITLLALGRPMDKPCSGGRLIQLASLQAFVFRYRIRI